MGRIGNGYGSEFHLLRWLGRHRDELTRKVQGVVPGLSNVKWRDFGFSSGSKMLDAELRKLSFLSKEELQRVGDKFESRLDPNWDAVAEGLFNGKKTYVLVEAKANVEEVGDDSAHGGKSREIISAALESAAREITGEVDMGERWMGKYYQLANRLYTQWVLNNAGIPAFQLSLFFCGDDYKKRTCPRNKEGWKKELEVEKEELQLNTSKAKDFLSRYYRELYIDVRSKRDIK